MIRLTRTVTRRALTWQGWLLLSGACVLALIGTALALPGFLARHEPIEARLLVVEGWMPDYALAEAAKVYQAGGYAHMLVTGAPLHEGVPHRGKTPSIAHLAKRMLRKHGIPAEVMTPVPGPLVWRNRTFTTAVAVRDWLDNHDMHGRPFNLVSNGAHARRSHLLYRLALGEDWPVGVYNAPTRHFDDNRWWTSSEGFREILSEAIAYVYVTLIFQVPEKP